MKTNYDIGDEVTITIKGATNNRQYQTAGEIVSITGNYATVRYRQPWAPLHNCIRTMMVDLRCCKKIKRRQPETPKQTGDSSPPLPAPTGSEDVCPECNQPLSPRWHGLNACFCRWGGVQPTASEIIVSPPNTQAQTPTI
jgi:hypothetical protein